MSVQYTEFRNNCHVLVALDDFLLNKKKMVDKLQQLVRLRVISSPLMFSIIKTCCSQTVTG